MAGTLLLHIGLDLFLEGVVDSYSYGGYDRLEYGGICLITVTMTALGMTAGLCAGVLAAVSVYAAQSITYTNPIRAQMLATTLLSSVWTRPSSELAILNDEHTGRSRILVVQLHGHLFFGNATQLTDNVKKMLSDSQQTGVQPLIVSNCLGDIYIHGIVSRCWVLTCDLMVGLLGDFGLYTCFGHRLLGSARRGENEYHNASSIQRCRNRFRRWSRRLSL
jgi:hypothetical protein